MRLGGGGGGLVKKKHLRHELRARRARSECAQVEGAKRPVVFTRNHWLSRSLVPVRVSETHLGLRKPLA